VQDDTAGQVQLQETNAVACRIGRFRSRSDLSRPGYICASEKQGKMSGWAELEGLDGTTAASVSPARPRAGVAAGMTVNGALARGLLASGSGAATRIEDLGL